MDIKNVTFVNNKVSSYPFSNDDQELLPTEDGNIYIQDISGQWLNNSIRIYSSLIKGGVAILGAGVYLIQTIKYPGSLQKSTEIERTVLISSTQFMCNRATGKDAFGVSLVVDEQPGDYNITWYSMSPNIKLKRLTITDTIFEGTCTDSSNIDIGLGWYAPYLPTWYSVVLLMSQFKGIPHHFLHFTLSRSLIHL